jgi:excisionase family DNA binding protein
MRTENQAPPRWVSPEQAADHLGVQPNTVRRMIARGELTGYKLGNKLIRLDANQLDSCLQAMAISAADSGVARPC